MASLLLLPDELKLQIVANIDIDINNTLIKLRQVHSWFRASITSMMIYYNILAAELDTSSPLRKEVASLWKSYLACHICHRVFPKGAFSDRQASGGFNSYRRICVGCCIKRRFYASGSIVSIDGRLYRACEACRGLFKWQSSGVNYCNQYSKGGKEVTTINNLTDLLAKGAYLSAGHVDAPAKFRWEKRLEERFLTSEVENLSLGSNIDSLEVPGPWQSHNVPRTLPARKYHN